MQGVEKRQSFLEGALFLTVGVLAVKVIGALYKVPLSAVIGEAGMGYFSTAYSVYNVIFTFSTAGLPVAVARAVSAADAKGDRDLILKTRRTALPLFFFTGLSGFLAVLLFAPPFLSAVGNPDALPALLALSPAVLFCSTASAYRGYFEGKRNMVPTAVSQVIEAAAKLVFGLTFAVFVMRTLPENGTPYGAAAAIFGVTLGALLSLLYLARKAKSRVNRPKFKPGERKRISKNLVKAALPVSAGAVAVSVSGLIDASFLQTRLLHIVQSDPAPLFSKLRSCIPEAISADPAAVPNYLFGCYNMALTLFMLIPGITQAFATSALPNVSAAFIRGDRRALGTTVAAVLRLTLFFALPAGLGLSALAEPAARLVYGDRPSMPILSMLLSVMGISAVFSAVTTPLSAMLQAVGKTVLPVVLQGVGLVIKIILNYVLVGIPRVNLMGGALSTLVSGVCTAAALYIALSRTLKLRLSPDIWLKPLCAAAVSTFSALSTLRIIRYMGFSGRFSALPCVVTAVLFYAAAAYLFGAIPQAGPDGPHRRGKVRKNREKS